jgi:putative phosphoesterase
MIHRPCALGFAKSATFQRARNYWNHLLKNQILAANYYGANSVKILIISDVHGNYEALDCVIKNVRYDVLLCCGDIAVDYPFPEQCISLLKDNCAHICCGNGDYIISRDQKPSDYIGKRYAHLAEDLDRASELATGLISEDSMKYLLELPRECRFVLDDISFYMNHTGPRMSLHQYLDLSSPYPELDKYYQDIEADVIFTGHTHIPYIKKVRDKILVNPGSVGEPRDGDPRASFATFDTATGQLELGRLEYDFSETRQVLKELGYPGYSLYCLENGFLLAAPVVSFDCSQYGKLSGH